MEHRNPSMQCTGRRPGSLVARVLAGGSSCVALLSPAFGQICFESESPIPAGLGPQSIASADLNGDGRLDLVVANFPSDTVSVFLSLGHGDFGPPVPYPTAAGPVVVTTADLDGDGDADLVIAEGTAA